MIHRTVPTLQTMTALAAVAKRTRMASGNATRTRVEVIGISTTTEITSAVLAATRTILTPTRTAITTGNLVANAGTAGAAVGVRVLAGASKTSNWTLNPRIPERRLQTRTGMPCGWRNHLLRQLSYQFLPQFITSSRM